MQLRLRALLVSFYCMSLLVSMGRPLVLYVVMSVRSGRSFWYWGHCLAVWRVDEIHTGREFLRHRAL